MSSPRYESANFSYLTSSLRKRFIQECATLTIHRRVCYPEYSVLSFRSSLRLRIWGMNPLMTTVVLGTLDAARTFNRERIERDF
jgi:hypothetical protein